MDFARQSGRPGLVRRLEAAAGLADRFGWGPAERRHAASFDLDRGVKFETYCVPRIRGAMLDELRTMDWVPRLVRSKASKMEETRKELEAALGRPPRHEEMAEKMGISLEEFQKQISEATAVTQVSLNKKWYETDSYKDVREIDILEDKKAEDPTGRLQNRDLMKLVTRGLNRNERLIVILYYYEELTMKEIGATLNLSESRVSQILTATAKKLRGLINGDSAPGRNPGLSAGER